MKNKSITLTINQIYHLAQFVGLNIDPRSMSEEERETEVTIEENMNVCVQGDEYITGIAAYMSEYQDDGAQLL